MRGFFFLVILSSSNIFSQKLNYNIISDTPASHFTEALPLGNGRIGAMVFGNTGKERIALNEISLWSGGPQDADKDSAYVYLKPIQDLLLNHQNKKAQDLLMKHFTAKGDGSGYGNGANVKYGCYQTFGDFFIDWGNHNDKIEDYKNNLDIENAVSETTYKRNGVRIQQKVFTDYKNDVLWVSLSSDGKLPNFSISLDRKENVLENKATENGLIMQGQLPSGKDRGMRYAATAQVMKHNGQLSVLSKSINVSNANYCVIAIDLQTDYDNPTGNLLTQLDLIKKSQKRLKKIKNITIDAAQAASTKAYQSYFSRSAVHLNHTSEQINPVTRQRLIDFNKGKTDAKLTELYFNFGKYLLISSSRPGLLPANLQGLWAEEYQTPWNGDYHLNINLQMNYWPAETTNLSDLAEPLFRFTKNLVPNGSKTARKYYNAKGWAAHVITNPWFFTSPGEGADWGSTLTGGAWLSTHLWDHYLYSQDKKFLKQYFPVLKGSAEFLQDILIEEKEHGTLVTAPSNSPENTYIMPNGFQGNTCMGPTMDMQISRNVFEAVIESSKILNKDKNFAEKLNLTKQKLAPNRISKDGGIQEWLDDWPSAEPQHRHVSHLFGLYPYDEITQSATPNLFDAAKKTLEMRGDGGTGWSKAWKINFWARLQDGDRAFKMLKELLNPAYYGKRSAGGTYPNLFDAHPPFQIDGNFGATAGIAEMLLQSHGKNNVIKFLPAIPNHESFKNGSVKGFKARNNFETNFTWNNFVLSSAEIISKSGKVLNVEIPAGMVLENEKGNVLSKITDKPQTLSFKTNKGSRFIIKPSKQ